MKETTGSQLGQGRRLPPGWTEEIQKGGGHDRATALDWCGSPQHVAYLTEDVSDIVTANGAKSATMTDVIRGLRETRWTRIRPRSGRQWRIGAAFTDNILLGCGFALAIWRTEDGCTRRVYVAVL